MAKRILLPPVLQKATHTDTVFLILNYKTDRNGDMKIEENARYDITDQLKDFLRANPGYLEREHAAT